MEKIKQEEYMEFVAEKYYKEFFSQGFATPGHNGPHGHIDTPIRNTGNFLMIYTYLYKKNKDSKYLELCKKFAKYICEEAKKSKNGAIKCMTTNKFNYLNGLVGQAWAIEALLYYYGISYDVECLETACKIFYAQKYDYDLHIWRLQDIDGKDIGISRTYNHNVWFIACASKILEYKEDAEILNIVNDFLTKGVKRDFRIYSNGLLKHLVKIAENYYEVLNWKSIIRFFLYPLRKINLRKLDTRYIEKGYHVFDMYGFCMLEERFPNYDFFSSKKYKKAINYALNYKKLNKELNIYKAIKHKNNNFNIYSYTYNSLAFEYPYVSSFFGKKDYKIYKELYEIQCELMYDADTKLFSKYNPDQITFDGKTSEIIKFLEMEDLELNNEK